MKRIAIYYDSLVSKGGAERVVIELANSLGADIITSGYNEKLNEWIPIKNKILDIGNISIKYIKPIGTLFESPIRYYLARNKFNYDIHIFFGTAAIFASNKRNLNIWYSFTPNRILYDLRKVRLNDKNWVKKLLFKLHIKLFYNLDQKVIKSNFKKIISQSVTTQKRVKKYYDLKSSIIYSPIDVKSFEFESFGDFYLSVARLYEDKRVDLIARSFINMPNKKLIIVGDGPKRKALKREILNYKNITLLTDVSDTELRWLYANCIATIYMPKNEDFGLVPLEGMASGKPCIAVNEGGCLETVVNNKTGLLIKASEVSIRNAVNKLTATKVKSMKVNCITWVKKFDITNLLNTWHLELQNY